MHLDTLAFFRGIQVARLAAEVGTGGASIAAASRIGQTYGSDVFKPGPLTRMCCARVCVAFLFPRSAHDGRIYKKLVSSNLAFRNLISFHHIPVLDDEDNLVLREWPLILPSTLAWPLDENQMYVCVCFSWS